MATCVPPHAAWSTFPQPFNGRCRGELIWKIKKQNLKVNLLFPPQKKILCAISGFCSPGMCWMHQVFQTWCFVRSLFVSSMHNQIVSADATISQGAWVVCRSSTQVTGIYVWRLQVSGTKQLPQLLYVDQYRNASLRKYHTTDIIPAFKMLFKWNCVNILGFSLMLFAISS